MTSTAQLELIQALIDGLAQDPLWSTFLERLRQMTRAEHATLICQSPRGDMEDALYLMAGGSTPDEARQMFRRFRYPDSAARNLPGEEGVPLTLEQLMRLDGGRHATFFGLLRDGHGMTAVRQMRVREARGIDAWLTIVRSGPDFGEVEARLLTDIAPMLRGVLHAYVTSEQHRFAAVLAGDAVSRLQYGWIALDASGTVLIADQFAEAVLARSGAIRRSATGQIAAEDADVHRELHRAVAALSTDPRARPRVIQVRTDPWLDILLTPARHRPLTAMGAPAVIAYVHGDNWSSTDRQAQLAELFSLTASEARLALAICRGRTIAEAARELGLSIESARTYSKTIFAKTGARGQPDLVRIIMGSVLALAPMA